MSSNIVISEKKKQKKNKSDISYMPGKFWDKVIDFTDKPVVQCDVPPIGNTVLDNDHNDGCK